MIDLTARPSRRRAVTAHLIVGGLLQALFVVQSLVVLPLGVGMLGKEAFGFWLATGGILGWLSVANFGVAGLTVQRCAAAYGRGDLQGARDWFMHGVVFSGASALLLACLVFSVAAFAPSWLGATGALARQLTTGMIVAGCGFALTPVNDTARGFVCALQRNGVALTAEITAAALAFGFTVWSLFAGWGIAGLAWGSAIRMFAATVFSVGIAACYARLAARSTRWSSQILSEYRRCLAPLWSASVVSQVVAPLPVVLLTKLLGPVAGPSAAVAYTATVRPLGLVETFTMHAVSSTSAALSHLVEDPKSVEAAPQRIRSASSWIFATACAGIAVVCLGDKGFISLWVGADSFLGQPFVLAAAVASFALVQFRWLTNLGTSLGLVTSTANVQAVEGVMRAILMAAGVLLAGPVGIPVAAAISLLGAAAMVERRMAAQAAFPRVGIGRLDWLLGASVMAAAASVAAPLVRSEDWLSWLASMLASAVVVAFLVCLFSPDLRCFARGLWLRSFRGRAPAS
jgi:O-antigen/teichoic acid export membrane protein